MDNKERLNQHKEELRLLGIQMKSLLTTSKDVIQQLDEGLFAENTSQKERLSICFDCDSYNKRRDLCKECGCIMRMKTKLNAAKCPLHKW
jgi:membrane protease subunit (stomatin/prohibitin family)